MKLNSHKFKIFFIFLAIFLLIKAIPFELGCFPSDWFSSAFKATPSRRRDREKLHIPPLIEDKLN